MLTIRLRGSEQVTETLKGQKKRLGDYRSYFEEIVTPALYKRFGEIFEKQGAIDGMTRWKPLAPATLAAKARRGHRLEILRRTDRLYKAYTGKNSYGRLSIKETSLRYQNIVPYGIFHERGTSRLPKRDVIERLLDYKAFRKELETGLVKYVEGQS